MIDRLKFFIFPHKWIQTCFNISWRYPLTPLKSLYVPLNRSRSFHIWWSTPFNYHPIDAHLGYAQLFLSTCNDTLNNSIVHMCKCSCGMHFYRSNPRVKNTCDFGRDYENCASTSNVYKFPPTGNLPNTSCHQMFSLLSIS